MTKVETTCDHQKLMDDIKEVVERHQHLPLAETIAVICQFVGGLVFMMDPEQFDPNQIAMVVLGNVKIGNDTALENSALFNPMGSA